MRGDIKVISNLLCLEVKMLQQVAMGLFCFVLIDGHFRVNFFRVVFYLLFYSNLNFPSKLYDIFTLIPVIHLEFILGII